MNTIKNIFCIGRNYSEHIKELHNETPEKPVVFNKPTHALVKADGRSIQLPNGQGEIHHEVEVVIKLARDYEVGSTVDDLVEKMAIGLDLTLRDVQQTLKDQGHPWLLSKGFPNSAVLSRFIRFPGMEASKQQSFSLLVNDKKVQHGYMKDMLFDLHQLITYIGTNFGLKKDDVIFTGTPSGVGPLHDGDQLSLKWNDAEVGSCSIEMK